MHISDLFKNSYVINLDHHTDRLQNFYKTFSDNNLPLPTRFPGIYGTTLPRYIKDKILENALPRQYSTDGHIGCGLSHYSLWNTDSDFITIFEDDIQLHPVITKLLNVELPEDWDMLYIGHKKAVELKNTGTIIPSPDYKTEKLSNFYIFRDQNEFPMGLYGYALNLKSERMRELLSNFRFQYNVDVYFQKNAGKINVYGIYPVPVIHDYHFGTTTAPTSNTPLLSYYSYLVSNQSLNFIYLILPSLLLVVVNKKFIYLTIFLFIFSIISYRIYLKNYGKNSEKFVNLPGIFDTHVFDAFGNVWDEKYKKITLNMLGKFHQTCKKSGIEYFIVCGTLLGWARHDRKFIPWDDDLDVGVSSTDMDRLLDIYKNDPEYVIYEKNVIGYKFYKIYNKKCLDKGEVWPFIDIFVYTANGPVIEWNYNHGMNNIAPPNLKLSSPLEILEDKLEGVSVMVPTSYQEILNSLYGDNWREMCHSSSYCHRTENQIDQRYLAKVECKYLI